MLLNMYNDYAKEAIPDVRANLGGKIYRCLMCKVAEPLIDGRLEGHAVDCAYRFLHTEIIRLRNIRTAETLASFMRIVDAYAYDYAAQGKLSPSRKDVENALTQLLNGD